MTEASCFSIFYVHLLQMHCSKNTKNNKHLDRCAERYFWSLTFTFPSHSHIKTVALKKHLTNSKEVQGPEENKGVKTDLAEVFVIFSIFSSLL